MVKHIVLFKLKNEVSAEEKQAVALKFKAAIEALPAVIPFIKHVEVGININPTNNGTLPSIASSTLWKK